MKINNPFKFIIPIVVSELAGIIGSVFTIRLNFPLFKIIKSNS